MKNFLMQILRVVCVSMAMCEWAVGEHARLFTNSYLKLITDLKGYYNATSVYFVAGDSLGADLLLTTILSQNLKRLSAMQTFSQVVRYADMDRDYNATLFHSPRQLFVVPVDNESSLQAFANFSKHHILGQHVWFLTFYGQVHPRLAQFCQNPDAATLRLGFDVRMLVKCYDHSSMHEWWSVKNNILTNLLFEWQAETGLLHLKTQLNLYQRRYDVAGTILKVSSVKEHPSALAAKVNGEDSPMFTKMMSELAASMNFILHFVTTEHFYGYYNKTDNKWNGILAKLQSKEIDVAVSEMSMTKDRLTAFDFTCPLILTRTRLFIKEPASSDVQWNSYLRAFDRHIWISLLALIIIAAILLTLIKVTKDKLSRVKGHLVEHHLCVWGIYCQQGLSEFPESSPLRVAYVSIFFSAVVLSAVYSASIISYLTLVSPMLPFHNLPQFLNDSSYKLIVIRNSYEHELFMTSEDWVLKGMYRLMKRTEDLPTDDIEAFRQVCNERVAYYSNGATVRKLADRIPCKLANIRTGRVDNLAFALSKHNSFTEFMNYNILRFRDSGIIKRMKDIYLKGKHPPAKHYDSVGIWGIAPLLTILMFGLLLSLMLLLLERLHRKITTVSFEKDQVYSLTSAFGLASKNCAHNNNQFNHH